jgi:hypothetical protein
MPNISSIGAGIYTSLAFIDQDVVSGVNSGSSPGTGDTAANWTALFEARQSTSGVTAGQKVDWDAGTDAKSFGRIREFPNLGIPANVVNVPQYGQGSSSQISGQSDSPSLDFTFNYVPTEHAFISELRAGGENLLFRVRLSNAQQIEESTGVITPYEEAVGSGSDMREFSDFYFFGSVASFEIVPNLTDSNQLNVTLTIDGEMRGPSSYTPDAVLANAPVYA